MWFWGVKRVWLALFQYGGVACLSVFLPLSRPQALFDWLADGAVEWRTRVLTNRLRAEVDLVVGARARLLAAVVAEGCGQVSSPARWAGSTGDGRPRAGIRVSAEGGWVTPGARPFPSRRRNWGDRWPKVCWEWLGPRQLGRWACFWRRIPRTRGRGPRRIQRPF